MRKIDSAWTNKVKKFNPQPNRGANISGSLRKRSKTRLSKRKQINKMHAGRCRWQTDRVRARSQVSRYSHSPRYWHDFLLCCVSSSLLPYDFSASRDYFWSRLLDDFFASRLRWKFPVQASVSLPPPLCVPVVFIAWSNRPNVVDSKEFNTKCFQTDFLTSCRPKTQDGGFWGHTYAIRKYLRSTEQLPHPKRFSVHMDPPKLWVICVPKKSRACLH